MAALHVKPGGLYVDCTLGGGGHSERILTAVNGNATVIGFDRDPLALQAAQERLEAAGYGKSLIPVHDSFSNLQEVLREKGISQVDGILADLGFSSPQVDDPERGFSYHNDGPLDMRMDPTRGISAADLLVQVSEKELARILKDYGEERFAKRIAKAIKRKLEETTITTTLELADVITQAMPGKYRRDKHPARRSFQAIRIAVNGELDELERLLDAIPDVIAPEGYAAIISFHSLEDRLVKRAMQHWEDPCECPKNLPCVCGKTPLGKAAKPVTASKREEEANPRARSARLRSFHFLPEV